MNSKNGRLGGLDTLRALAIALVLLYHYRVFVDRSFEFGWPARVGWAGVDLFFVLSGYLIGQQLLKGDWRAISLKGFWARRGLRTWPLFWIVLIAYFCWPGGLGGREPPALWRFLSFTQNLGLQPGTAFSHAWSLCVEEQFYLLLPLGLLALARLGGGRRAAWVLLVGLSLLALALRAWICWQFGDAESAAYADFYGHIYYASWSRFDEFLPGLAVALVQARHPALWAALQAHPRRVLMASLLLLAPALWWMRFHAFDANENFLLWGAVPIYALLAWGAAGLVVLALTPRTWLARTRVPGAAALARWSYAVYLSHKAVGELCRRNLADSLPGWGLFLLVMGLSLLLGWLLQRFIEAPVMRWRDGHAPPLWRPECQGLDVELATVRRA